MSALDFAGSTKLGTGFRHLKRYKDLISVFIKFGFVELLEHFDSDHRLALGILEGRQVPVCRLVLSRTALVDLLGKVGQMGAALKKAGVITDEPAKPDAGKK